MCSKYITITQLCLTDRFIRYTLSGQAGFLKRSLTGIIQSSGVKALQCNMSHKNRRSFNSNFWQLWTLVLLQTNYIRNCARSFTSVPD